MTSLNTSLDLYYERMHRSLGDKARLTEHIHGNDVLDIGCGSGDLVEYLTNAGYSASGLDAAEESVIRTKNRGTDARLGYADEVAELFGAESFDTILCSSVLHEVFSYGNRDTPPGKIASLRNAVSSFYEALRPGGVLIVRDGVSPGEETGHISVDQPNEVTKFLLHSPFTKGVTDREVSLERVGENRFRGTASSLMEFAFTYTWGQGSFEREVQEFYGVFTLDDYTAFLEAPGFDLLHSYAYQQPGYAKHLVGKVEFEDIEFPQTNAVWVMRKPY